MWKKYGKKSTRKKKYGGKKKYGENWACAEHTSEKRAGNPVAHPWGHVTFGHVTSWLPVRASSDQGPVTSGSSTSLHLLKYGFVTPSILLPSYVAPFLPAYFTELGHSSPTFYVSWFSLNSTQINVCLLHTVVFIYFSGLYIVNNTPLLVINRCYNNIRLSHIMK